MREAFDLENKMTEMVDRCRRMETRLTKFLDSQGFDTGTRRPVWRDGTIVAPSIDCSVKDLLRCVPSDWPLDEEIFVSIKRDLVMSIFLPTTMPKQNRGED